MSIPIAEILRETEPQRVEQLWASWLSLCCALDNGFWWHGKCYVGQEYIELIQKLRGVLGG